MKASVRISRRAGLDLKEIEKYSVRKWGKRVGRRYLESIEEALSRLRENPGLLQARSEFSSRLKFYRVKEHFLVCALIEKNVYIVTIKHCAMDLPGRLKKLEPDLFQEVELLHKSLVKSRNPSQK